MNFIVGEEYIVPGNNGFQTYYFIVVSTDDHLVVTDWWRDSAGNKIRFTDSKENLIRCNVRKFTKLDKVLK